MLHMYTFCALQEFILVPSVGNSGIAIVRNTDSYVKVTLNVSKSATDKTYVLFIKIYLTLVGVTFSISWSKPFVSIPT